MTAMADLIAFNGIWFFPLFLGQLGPCVPVTSKLTRNKYNLLFMFPLCCTIKNNIINTANVNDFEMIGYACRIA